MRNRFLALPLAAALAAPAVSSAAEAGAKQPPESAWLEQQVQTCAACHGPRGVPAAGPFPVIAGQYRDYLVHTLTAYRDGERKNPVMAIQAQGLTDAQIKALARFYARQDSPLRIPSIRE